MFLSSKSDIRVESSGYDVSYILPARPLGKLRWFGLLLVGFSVLFISGPAKGVFESLERFTRSEQPGFEFLAFAFQLFFVVAGCVAAFVGFLIMFGHCRVDWREQRLSDVECLGPFRWRRRMPREPVRLFRVDFTRDGETDRPVTEGPFAKFGVLWAIFERSKPRMLVLGYPRDWLESLASDLAARVGASSASTGTPRVEVMQAADAGLELADVPEKPPASRITQESRPGGLVLAVPPAGLRKVTKGVLIFGIFWCLIVSLIAALAIFTEYKNARNIPWFVFVLFAGFWLVGFGAVAAAVNMGKRRATISIEGRTLRVAVTSLFGTKSWEWRPGEVEAIRADKSGMEINNAPIIELQIQPTGRKKIGFFAGRDPQELRWLATELRRALQLPAKAEESSTEARI